MFSSLLRATFVALTLVAAPTLAQQPFTFTVNSANNTFTYSDAQRTFSGIFVKPAGDGPFPAIIINHGQGGTPASYSLPKANEMSPWGLVCIAPELTHASGGDTSPEGSGNNPENVARGLACRAALASLSYVDSSRLAVWGHSKGAYATIGQVAAMGSQIKAAGISAGGSVPDSFGTNQAAPTATEAQPTTAPFIMYHGTTDGTVPPTYSENFRDLLVTKGVPASRQTFDTTGLNGSLQHNLHQTPSFNEAMLTGFRAWLETHGGLVTTTSFNHRPSLAWIADQRATPGAVLPVIPVTVTDPETTASALTVVATSSNQALLPDANITVGGSGSDRTLTLAPASGQTGLATITVTVTDAADATSAISFTLTVAASVAGNTAPVIQGIANVVLVPGALYGPHALVVKDTESNEGTLTLSATSSNTALVPNANIVFGGQNWGRQVTVTPASGVSGRATVTLSVSDGTNLASTSFVLEVANSGVPPTLSGLPTHRTLAAAEGPTQISFSVTDADTAPENLRVTATSSNATLFPGSNVAVSGTGPNRILTVTPASGQQGAATLTLTVSDGVFTHTAQVLVVVVSPTAFSRPRGIFVLDAGGPATYTTTFGSSVSLRDGNIRDLPFVDGFTLRVAWDEIEGGLGQYDFFILKNALTKLPLGQKLSVIVVPQDPAYIAATSGVQTWNDAELTRAVPWDPVLRERRRALIIAMAAYEVDGIPLGSHPRIDTIDPYLPGGFTGLRDPNSAQLRTLPGYTRAKLLGAVQDELRTWQDAFPSKFIQTGFWPITDNENASYGGLLAWEWLRDQLLAKFNGTIRPRVGFFMENLAAKRPGPAIDPFSATPVTAFGSPMFTSQAATWNGFQMLGSWTRPFNDGHVNATLNGTPNDALEYAFNSYGAEYHEIYSGDIDNVAFQPALQRWHDFYQSAVTTDADSDEDHDGLPFWWELAAGMNPRQASGDDGAGSDRDGNGTPALIEFGSGATHPGAAAWPLLPTTSIAIDPGSGLRYLTFRYLRRIDAPSLEYNVEASGDLGLWNSGPDITEQSGTPVPSGDGITEWITERILPAISAESGQRFVRLRIGVRE